MLARKGLADAYLDSAPGGLCLYLPRQALCPLHFSAIKVAGKQCGRLRSRTYSQQMAPESREDALSSVFGQNSRATTATGRTVVVADMERWALLLVPDRL